MASSFPLSLKLSELTKNTNKDTGMCRLHKSVQRRPLPAQLAGLDTVHQQGVHLQPRRLPQGSLPGLGTCASVPTNAPLSPRRQVGAAICR